MTEKEEYRIISSSFFKSNSKKLFDLSEYEKQLHYLQFALTDLEKQELIKCEQLKNEIAREVTLLGEIQTENEQKIDSIRYANDDELKSLLKDKCHHDAISCVINRITQTITILFEECDDLRNVQKLFSPILDKSEMTQKNRETLKISFELSKRDAVINQLKLSERCYVQRYIRGMD